MDALEDGLRHYVSRQLPRVLTQMDRDPGSPTFGCFDRNYWHYKIRDFPSAILQQGAFAVDALRRSSESPEILVRWSAGAVNALGRLVDRTGGVDEYYPFERSYPAAAFGLWTAARLLADWQASAPRLAAAVDPEPLRRLADHVGRRVEVQAMNQQAAGLAGIVWAAQAGLAPDRSAGHADRLFAAQHVEGWFEEYGGPDFGYLTVTLDALADYHDATGDERALSAADRAVGFLAALVGADGRLPSTLNSRNTDYVVPYGLARAAARNPLASWLVHTLFRDAADPGCFLWATDDRYHAHYIYASCVRSLEHLGRMLPPEPPPVRTSVWLAGCGYWARWPEDRSWTVYVGARKGGLVRVHRRNGAPVADYGWRLEEGGRLWSTNWWSDVWTAETEGNSIRIRGACQRVGYHVPRPWKHAVLRLAAWVLRDRLVPLLKRLMIFRPGGAVGPAFERLVEVDERGVRVTDRLEVPPGARAWRSPRQNLRHVASADSFSPEELHPPAGQDTEPGWRWEAP